MLSRTLDAVNLARNEQTEALSTEDILSLVDTTTERIMRESRRVVVGSIDAVALFPLLNIWQSAKLCGQAVGESQLRF